jgi:hypothetical protein
LQVAEEAALSANLTADLGLAWRCPVVRWDDERLRGGGESDSEGERAALRLDERPRRWRESDGSGVCLNDSVKLGHSSARC